ncbi:MAG: spermidine synthase [bacterium]
MFLSLLKKIRYNFLYYYYRYTTPDKILFEGSTPFNHVKVQQAGSKLRLIFVDKEKEYTESERDLLDPLFLSLEYTRMTFVAFSFFSELSSIKRILMIGLGGGVYCPLIREYLPDAVLDIVEIDEQIADLARRYFQFEETSRVNLYIEDARDYVKRTDRRYDLVLSDPYILNYVPANLRTIEYYRELKGILTENGVFSGNIPLKDRLITQEIKTIINVFSFCRLLSGVSSNNGVIVASGRPADYFSKQELLKQARRLDKKHRFHFKQENLVKCLHDIITPIDCEALTDDRFKRP